VPIAARVLYPVFAILLSPTIASAAMTFSSVSVIGNALRATRRAVDGSFEDRQWGSGSKVAVAPPRIAGGPERLRSHTARISSS
jgi:hypothetical protein